MSRLERVALVVILLVAAALRLAGNDWDDFQHHHPDERYITWVATTIDFPSLGSLSRADWQPQTSTFNPFRWPPGAASEGIVVLQDEPRDFAYGHVPLYLGVLATRLVERLGPALLSWLPAEWSLTADVLNGAGRIEFHHLAAVGRALTALVDVGTVLLIFALGRRLYGTAVGLLAAAFLALTVLHIQLAHFFTSDPYLTFFTVATLYALVLAHGTTTAARRRAYLLLAAVAIGLAVGSKFTAVLLVVPLAWTVWATGRPRRWWAEALAGLGVAALVFALTNPFALLDRTCPLPEQPPSLGPLALPEGLARSCYLQNVTEQNAMVRGAADLGFTRQYEGTLPYLYFIEMQIRWGMGPLLGVVAFAGLGWALGRSAIRENRATAERRLGDDPVVIVLLWVVPTFVLTGSFAVKFMRYMQPITPLLVLFGAALLMAAGRRLAARRASEDAHSAGDGVAGGEWLVATNDQRPTTNDPPRAESASLDAGGPARHGTIAESASSDADGPARRGGASEDAHSAGGGSAGGYSAGGNGRRVASGLAAGVLLFTAAYALAFVAIYGQEHPWNAASRWVYANVPPGTTLLSEQWDDYLPATMILDGQQRRREEFPNDELTWLSSPDAADDEAKLRANLEKLAAAEYVTILSNRVYGVVPRLPERFPLSSQYHQLLFDGRLGYELVWVGDRTPRLLGLSLVPDTFGWPGLTPPAGVVNTRSDGPSISFGRVDESFVVYDQPLTMIFRNVGGMTAAEMREEFN